MNKKNTRGGARAGAGAKKKDTKSLNIRPKISTLNILTEKLGNGDIRLRNKKINEYLDKLAKNII